MEQQSTPTEAAHPTPLTYIKVAVILAIITAVEVAVFYIDVLEPAFLAIFLILSAVKFAIVVLFYMHLKFDAKIFTRFFVAGFVLAVIVAIALLGLFRMFSD